MKFVGGKKKSQWNEKYQYRFILSVPCTFNRGQAEIIHIMEYQGKQFRPYFKDEKLFQ